ncbi:DUF2089 domain-containing protein [Velocimicrobium porci]|uniref:DUF2089 domain-containing protein n=1 Tax=Velocimicrobium porci TaxID=2606634 RepID=A0A6L5XWB3_9FIRM|nr:DUF2089 family protein [Velocimicrobium porci]MSS62817.1 DUF2089 domain-containing protein [Velocimicrobium porci]
MAQHIIGYCPVCNEKLIATKLSCRTCGLELSNEFSLNKFSFLKEEDLLFIELFIQYNGNLKELQKQLKLSYPAVKKRLHVIQVTLGLKPPVDTPNLPEPAIRELPIYKNDSLVIQKIKSQLNMANGLVKLTLPKGTDFYIYYEEYGNGLCATNLPSNRILHWSVFDQTITLLQQKNGRAIKGNAMKGKLGSNDLPFDSVEGYIAANTYHAQKGDSCLRMISTVAAILEWTGLCINGYGYIELIEH